MNFFHISKPNGIGSHKLQSEYFAAVCADKDITYNRLITQELSPLDYLDLPAVEGDIVYRSAAGVSSETLERELISLYKLKSIHDSIDRALTGRGSSYDLMRRKDLPVIPSVPFLPWRKKDSLLLSEYVGGFPLVIKVDGGMEGVGVMRVDSIESFNSVADFLRRDASAKVRVMKYIPHEFYARLVVVGDRVVAATRDFPPLGDFRANARGPRGHDGEPFTPSQKMQSDAVKAVQAIGVKASGVDFLVVDERTHYISEANAPFNFAETQKITGVNIALSIVDTLEKV